MPWAKILRSDQVTLPKEVRETLNLKEGDIIDFEIKGSTVIVRPKELVDKQATLKAFAQAIDDMRGMITEEGLSVSEEELEKILAEAVAAARKKRKAPAARTKTAET